MKKLSLLGLMALSTGLAWAQSSGNRVMGQTTAMGEGTITSWVDVDASGRPLKIGLTVTRSALEGLPFAEFNSVAKTFTVRLPRVKGVPYVEISVDSATMGHDPFPVYGVEHLDMHFYLCDQAERSNWLIKGPADIKKFDKPVPPGYMPADYIMVPTTEIPTMGVHWVDMSSPEFHNKGFTCSMIMGSYNGKLQFAEPMMTREFLLTKPQFSARFPAPKFAEKPGYYPRSYSVNWIESKGHYEIALGDLVNVGKG